MVSEKSAMLRASRESRRILRRMFWEEYETGFKDRQNIVTSADRESERRIIEILEKVFPDYNILSEEKGRIEKGSEYTWVIDPLDGTTNFRMKNPFFCSAIALARGKEIVMAVVNSPFLKEEFFAEKGNGAFLNGKRMRVSGNGMEEAVIAYCSIGERRSIEVSAKALVELRSRAVDVRRIGAGELELSYVAAGRLEAFYMLNLKSPWDVAAGSLIVREAGGKATNLYGKEWNLGDSDIVASNGVVHKEILDVLQKVRKDCI